MNRVPIEDFPENMRHTGPLYSPRADVGKAVAFNDRLGYPDSGCHGDRVETVSRGREPSTIRDPAPTGLSLARSAIAK